MLIFFTWVTYQSESSQKMETTLVISERGHLMPQIDYPEMEELHGQQEASAIPRTGGTVARWPRSQGHQVELQPVTS